MLLYVAVSIRWISALLLYVAVSIRWISIRFDADLNFINKLTCTIYLYVHSLHSAKLFGSFNV